MKGTIAERAARAGKSLKEVAPTPGPIALYSCLGFDPFTEWTTIEGRFPFREIDGLPDIEDAALLIARVEERSILILSGGSVPHYGSHFGLSAAERCLPIWALAKLGIERLVICHAALGLSPNQSPGDVVIVSDHIDLSIDHPLAGDHAEILGPAYLDMSQVYDPSLSQRLETRAQAAFTSCHRGVLAYRPFPTGATRAELSFFHRMGADLLGDSSVQEAIVAKHAGMAVATLSALLDVNPPPHDQSVSLDSMIQTADSLAPVLSELMASIVIEDR